MMGERMKPWREAFSEVVAFIESREDIRVDEVGISVPREAREEFYHLIEQVQRGLAYEILGPQADAAREAARHCLAARERLLKQSGLEAYRLPPTLEQLLVDADGALAKPAFALVLDALQHGTDAGLLEERARRELPAFCATLRRSAYEMWAYLGVVDALKPVRFWAVFSPDTEEVHAVETCEVTAGVQVTSPERRMPEAAFEAVDGRVFACKMEAARELDYYGVKIERRRDSSAGGNTEGLLSHRVLLLYRLNSIEELGVTVDRQERRQVPCDLMCEVLEPADMSCPAYVSSFVARINAVRSRRAVQVFTFDAEGAFPEGMLDDPSVAPIERRIIGYEEAELVRVADMLRDKTISE